MNGAGHPIETDSMLSRLKRLLPRLLVALLRHERRATAPALSSPSPRERERVVGREGRSEAEARVGGMSDFLDDPHPDRLTPVDPPRKGEGSTAPSGTQGGRAG
jgi:hypothetical protein